MTLTARSPIKFYQALSGLAPYQENNLNSCEAKEIDLSKASFTDF